MPDPHFRHCGDYIAGSVMVTFEKIYYFGGVLVPDTPIYDSSGGFMSVPEERQVVSCGVCFQLVNCSGRLWQGTT